MKGDQARMGSRQKVKVEQAPISADMPKINLNAAGLDIGASEIWVAIPPGRESECSAPQTLEPFEQLLRG